jgi:hypothetical protein
MPPPPDREEALRRRRLRQPPFEVTARIRRDCTSAHIRKLDISGRIAMTSPHGITSSSASHATGGDQGVRRFSCRDQFPCMGFAQLTERESLRDIEACLRAREEKLYHMGFRGRVSRNTLGAYVRSLRACSRCRPCGGDLARPTSPNVCAQMRRT